MWKMLIIIGCFCLAACAVSREAMMKADYGPRPSNAEAVKKTTTYLEQILIEPDSLRLGCSLDMRRGWARDSFFDDPVFGWLIRCKVKAKYSLNGYTSNKDYVFVVNGPNVFGLELSRDIDVQRDLTYLFMGYAD